MENTVNGMTTSVVRKVEEDGSQARLVIITKVSFGDYETEFVNELAHGPKDVIYAVYNGTVSSLGECFEMAKKIWAQEERDAGVINAGAGLV